MSESALTPIEEKTVIFYEDEITAVMVQVNDLMEVYVPVRPLCEHLGVAWSPQRRRIMRDPVLAEVVTSVTVTVTEMGQRGVMLCLPLDYLNGWLFGINASRVNPEIKDNLIRYQKECYRVLANAFINQVQGGVVSPTIASLMQIKEMGLAIAQMAEEQIEFETRITRTEGRIDQAAVVVGQLSKRVSSLEKQLSPGAAVTNDQAMQISQAVKAVAIALGKQSQQNEFGGVYGELYRYFGITSYKQLPANRFEECLDWLTEWFQEVSG